MAMDSQLSKKQIIKKNPILKYKYQKKVSYLTFRQLFLDHEDVSYLPIESQTVTALVVIHITNKMHSSNVEPIKNIIQSGTGQYVIKKHDLISELTCVYEKLKRKQTLKNRYNFTRNKFPYLIMLFLFYRIYYIYFGSLVSVIIISLM